MTTQTSVTSPTASSNWLARLRARGTGLSGRVLFLIIAFIMIAEVAIYIPSMANFRRNWINDRISSAYIAALVLEATPVPMVPKELSMHLLDSVGATMIVIKIHNMHRILAVSDMPPRIDETYDARKMNLAGDIAAAGRTLLAPPGRMLNIIGPAPMGGDSIEITLDETALQTAMRAYSIDVLLLSLLLCAIVGGLVLIALHFAILRPVARLTSSLVAFGNNPEDATRIIMPSQAGHELGAAERALKAMQEMLLRELRQKKNLAALGLAVAKINHDLRNMLASAQLLTDRLVDVPDAMTQRLAPKLVTTLDRAIRFCQTTLTFGKAADDTPQLRRLNLRQLVQEVLEALPTHLAVQGGPVQLAISNDVPEVFEITADPEQMYRVLNNLCRNAVDALMSDLTPSPRIIVRAARALQTSIIEVEDNGPGVSPHAEARLFAAFEASTRAGGTGLGLTIAADLVRAHGGRLVLIARPSNATSAPVRGATFRITLPSLHGATHIRA